MRQVKADELAVQVLEVLRHLRDHEHKLWDALVRSESGQLILELWDMVDTIELTFQNPAE